jgi:hypothetical protein
MDDITFNWYFYSWLEDREEEVKKMKDFGCFVGAFWNAEMAKKVSESEDGVARRENGKYSSTDEEFEKLSEMSLIRKMPVK